MIVQVTVSELSHQTVPSLAVKHCENTVASTSGKWGLPRPVCAPRGVRSALCKPREQTLTPGAGPRLSRLCWPARYGSEQLQGGWLSAVFLSEIWLSLLLLTSCWNPPRKKAGVWGETNMQMLLEIVIKKKFLHYEALPRNQKTVSKHM